MKRYIPHAILSTTFEAISALATAGALIAAIAAARQAKQLFDIKAARDERAEESARREHATQISAWAAMQILSGGVLIHGIVVRNASHDPVYDVQASCHGFTRDRMPRMQCVPPGEYFIANKSIHKPDGKVSQWDFAKPIREIRDPVRPVHGVRQVRGRRAHLPRPSWPRLGPNARGSPEPERRPSVTTR